jgi:hypothetical protein
VNLEDVFQVRMVFILDWKIKQLHNRVMDMVKFQWIWYNSEDETWENGDTMREEYPHIF